MSIAALVLAALVSPGCGALSLPAPTPVSPLREWTARIMLHDTPVDLHLARPVSMGQPPVLVLFASGDGGWFGSAIGMFKTIAANGYPVVGLSSRALLKIERKPAATPLRPLQLAQDYAQILDEARRQLGVTPETPAILTGWSRGAGFAVLAAAAMPSRKDAAGVVAIGLAAGENLRIDGPDDESDDDEDAVPSTVASRFAPYDTLVHNVAVPAVVIQATGDNYLPAARARALFGPDTPMRRFWEIRGHNHRFDGAEPAFVDAFGEALRWVTSRSSPGAAAMADDTPDTTRDSAG